MTYERILYNKTHISFSFEKLHYNLYKAMEVIDTHEKKKDVILQMIHAVQELHSLGYTHQKISPKKFLISQDLTHVKLKDFDIALTAEETQLCI